MKKVSDTRKTNLRKELSLKGIHILPFMWSPYEKDFRHQGNKRSFNGVVSLWKVCLLFGVYSNTVNFTVVSLAVLKLSLIRTMNTCKFMCAVCCLYWRQLWIENQGQVVQSIVSLTELLVKDSLHLLANINLSTWVFNCIFISKLHTTR